MCDITMEIVWDVSNRKQEEGKNIYVAAAAAVIVAIANCCPILYLFLIIPFKIRFQSITNSSTFQHMRILCSINRFSTVM
jgi:hypothetical protein